MIKNPHMGVFGPQELTTDDLSVCVLEVKRCVPEEYMAFHDLMVAVSRPF